MISSIMDELVELHRPDRLMTELVIPKGVTRFSCALPALCWNGLVPHINQNQTLSNLLISSLLTLLQILHEHYFVAYTTSPSHEITSPITLVLTSVSWRFVACSPRKPEKNKRQGGDIFWGFDIQELS